MAGTRRISRTPSLEEFLALPEREPSLEYIDGRIEAKVAPQKLHSVIQSNLVAEINRRARPAGLGLAFVELRCTFAGRSIVPDVAYLLDAHIEVDAEGRFVDTTTRPPDLHVEVISPDRRVGRSREKLIHSTANGCPLGWLIHPYRDMIEVYRAGALAERLGAAGVLDAAPVLPGFVLAAAEVFGWLTYRPRRPGPGGDPA